MRHPIFAIVVSLVTTVGASHHARSDGKYARLVAPPFTWTGFYVGGTAGYANANHSSDDVAGAFLGYPDLTNGQSQGFAGGGTLGVNLLSGQLVPSCRPPRKSPPRIPGALAGRAGRKRRLEHPQSPTASQRKARGTGDVPHAPPASVSACSWPR